MDIVNIESRLRELHDRLDELEKITDAEGRDLTDEEGREWDSKQAALANLLAERQRRADKQQLTAQLATALGRVSEPDEVFNQSVEPEHVSASAPVMPASAPRKSYPTVANPKALSNWGWPTFGSFARGVMLACRKTNAVVDPRLTGNAPTEYMRESVGEDGGFAVPPDYRTAIMQMIQGEDSLLPRTDQNVSSSNTFSQPVDDSVPWASTGGVRAYWTAEGAQKTQSAPNLKNVTLRLHKLAAIVPVTDELREDAPAIDGYLRSKTPVAFNVAINDAILNGTGVGQPEGILNAAATVTVAAEAGQAADTLHANNIIKMWGRLYSGYRNNAVWLMNQDVEAQLPYLAAAARTPDQATIVGPTATYLEPGALRNNNNFGLLYNRPVIVTEAASALGDVGDIVLASFDQYLTVTKVGGLRSDVSIHLWFDYDITAFRFVFRLAGAPWLRAPIPRKGSNTNTLSAFITLAAR